MLGRKPSFAVLFDMDGTIIDSEPYWMASEQALAAEHQGTWTQDDARTIIGLSLDKSAEVFKDRTNVPLETEEIVNRLSNEVQSKLEQLKALKTQIFELMKKADAIAAEIKETV